MFARQYYTFGQLVVADFHLREIAFAQLAIQFVQADPFAYCRVGLPFSIVVQIIDRLSIR